jgi:hypothetical protein
LPNLSFCNWYYYRGDRFLLILLAEPVEDSLSPPKPCAIISDFTSAYLS